MLTLSPIMSTTLISPEFWSAEGLSQPDMLTTIREAYPLKEGDCLLIFRLSVSYDHPYPALQ